MTKGIRENEPNARTVYADIIDLPHWESPTRPRMSLYNRAAQFAPFAALSGYDDIIQEEARETDTWLEPGESQKEQIDQQLSLIAGALSGGRKPTIRVTYFIPDEKKDGGTYATAEGKARKIDPVHRKILLAETTGSETKIDFNYIAEISLSDPSFTE